MPAIPSAEQALAVPCVAPAGTAALSAEKIPLESLVHHRNAVAFDLPLEEVHKIFGEKNVDFLALIRAGGVVGLCGRARLGFLLGSRFGFALYSETPAHEAQVSSPIILRTGTPIREVLRTALARRGHEFYEDVALVDESSRLLGLIPVEALARLQTRLVAEQLDELRRQSLELRELERHMHRQEKQRLLDTLVGGVAHELNNKLTPVLGFADLLAAGRSGPQFAGYISKSAGEAAAIIRQLLQLSKPATGNRQAVDLRHVVEESLLMLKFKLRESKAEIRTTLPPGRIEALADAAQIKQVMMNLVLNALHAMEGCAAPSLEIEVGRRDAHGYIRVGDNGSGISSEIVGRIFDPFFTTKGPDRGSGLGLSVCHSIVEQHGGEILVESEPGRGATFTVILPAAEPADQDRPRPGGEAGAAVGEAHPLEEGRRILVVEDEEEVSMLLQEVLSSAFGSAIDLAADGVEALRWVERRDYALVVSDVRMPSMGGTEFFLRLRELRPALAQRLVFVSGHVGDKALEAEIAHWHVPLLAKPFSPGQLKEICAPLLLRQPAATPA